MTQGKFLKGLLLGEGVPVTGCTEQSLRDESELDFLESAFNKPLLNLMQWMNRKDRFGRNVFEGGFLGLDRSSPFLTGGGYLEADGTAWINWYYLRLSD